MKKQKRGIPARTADPILKQLFDIADDRRMWTADLARKIGISALSLTRYKHGKSTPSIMTVNAMAEALGVRLVLDPFSECCPNCEKTSGIEETDDDGLKCRYCGARWR